MQVDNSIIKTFSEYFANHHEQIVNFTRELVEVESPSRDETGSHSVVSLLCHATEGIPNCKFERVASEGYGEHFRLTTFADSQDSRPIVLLGHTDTVHPRSSLQQRPWRVDGGKAYGPGVFDMKANCALALEVIRALNGIQPANRPVVLLLTCDEEAGSPSGRPLVEAEARNAEAVLVLEPPAKDGRVKTGHKGTGIFTIKATGLAAHAGLEPEKGASAIVELARQTIDLQALNGTGGISVNVGVFRGGTVSNVVPEQAWAEIDVRFSTAEEANRIEKQMRELHAYDERVQVAVTGGINRPPLERDEKVMALYKRAEAIADRLGFALGEAQVGGASDGNFAAAVGASVLDGLGIQGDGAHAIHEHIILDDIPRRAALLAGLICSF
jgi:glutamate carboxypeptidase